jgi:hypothetical protein
MGLIEEKGKKDVRMQSTFSWSLRREPTEPDNSFKRSDPVRVISNNPVRP